MRAGIVVTHEVIIVPGLVFSHAEGSTHGAVIDVTLDYDHWETVRFPNSVKPAKTVRAKASYQGCRVDFLVKNGDGVQPVGEVFIEVDESFDNAFERVNDTLELRKLLQRSCYLETLFPVGFELKEIEFDSHSYEHINIQLIPLVAS